MIAWGCNISVKDGKKPESYDYVSGFNTRPRWFEFECRAREGRGEVVSERMRGVWGERYGREGVGNLG